MPREDGLAGAWGLLLLRAGGAEGGRRGAQGGQGRDARAQGGLQVNALGEAEAAPREPGRGAAGRGQPQGLGVQAPRGLGDASEGGPRGPVSDMGLGVIGEEGHDGSRAPDREAGQRSYTLDAVPMAGSGRRAGSREREGPHREERDRSH